MSLLCSCDTGANGFGLIDCYGEPDRVVAYGFQQLKDGATENYLSATLLQAGWDGALYNKNGAVRISVLRNAKQVTDEREDPVTETIDTVDYIIRDGKRMIIIFSCRCTKQNNCLHQLFKMSKHWILWYFCC